MDDQQFHQEELSRRNQQIADLRGELWEVRDRADDAEDRTQQLQMAITKAKGEVRIRRAKMHELEDQADVAEAVSRDTARALMAARSAGVAEVAKLRHEMIELDQAYGLCTDAATKKVQRSNADLEGEVSDLHARLMAMQRDIERTRSELAQDEAAAEAKQAQFLALKRNDGEHRVKDAETNRAVALGTATAMRAELARVETALSTMRERSGEHSESLKRNVAQRQRVEEELVTMRHECKIIEAQAEEAKYGEALAISRQQCRHFAQDVANAKQSSLLHTQSIQGALDETRRMMTDHLDQTQRHIDETQRCPTGSSLALIMAALGEAKDRTAGIVATKQRLEREQSSIDDEILNLKASLAMERDRAQQHHKIETEKELANAQQTFETTNREINFAAENTRKAEAAAVEAERTGREHEKLLRLKLEELWAVLRQSI